MRNRRKVCLGAVVIAALALTAFLARDHEPSYKGRPLSYWASLYTAGRYHRPHPDPRKDWVKQHDAEEAIRAIGPSAVPYLVKWLEYEPSPAKTRFIMFMGRFRRGSLVRWVPDALTIDRNWLRVVDASGALAVLGPDARCAVPDLVRYATHVQNPAKGQYLVSALGSIGHEGVLALSEVLTSHQADQNSEAVSAMRCQIIGQLRGMEANAAFSLPALLLCLGDEDQSVAIMATLALRSVTPQSQFAITALATNAVQDARPDVRSAAVQALGSLGEQARPAMGSVLRLLQDSDPYVREAATNALLQTAPELLTNAPAH